MDRLKWWLRILLLFCIFEEICLEVDAARLRVVKVKKTRHDKRQTQRGINDGGQDDFNSNPLRPEDNPYNAGNRKVDYPLLNNQNNFQAQQSQPQRQERQQQQQRPSPGSKSYNNGGDDHCEGCGSGIPGEAGTDYPNYAALPKTNFDCKKQQWPGYYADVDARCQVFWICQKNRADAFLCPNGTLFNQQVFVCDWWFNVDCGTATEFYSRNQYIYGGPGIDLFGNQVPIHNRQSTPVSNNPVNTNQNVNRARPPTNRPPTSNFQQQPILHAPTTVIPIPNQQQLDPFNNPRQTGFQIPIVQTTESYVAATPEAPLHYNRRATDHFSTRNNVNNNGELTGKGQFVPTNQETGYLPQGSGGGFSRSSPANNNGAYNNGNIFNSNSGNSGNDFNSNHGNNGNNFNPNAGKNDEVSDGGSSYATYIDAQKRLHLGSNYKPKPNNNRSFHQNPLLTSTTSRATNNQAQQSQGYKNYAPKTQPSNYEAAQDDDRVGYGNSGGSGYNNGRGGYNNGGYSTTTKRNAVSLEDLDESSSNIGRTQETADEEIFDDDGMKFNFAKTVVPTTLRPTPLPRTLTTEIVKFRKPSTVMIMASTVPPVTTHRPYSRHVLKSAKKASWAAALDKNFGQTAVTSSSVTVPLTYIQVPPLDDQSEAPPPITTPSTFGKKMKSGKKRNTSNWSAYFHKN